MRVGAATLVRIMNATTTQQTLLCHHCGEFKPFDEMRKDSSYPNGVRNQCKACKKNGIPKSHEPESMKCKGCGERKPLDEMRKDSRYASGYRPQCLSCKRRMDAAQRQRKRRQRKPAEERLYPCNYCGREDVPYDEMSKDKNKFMGVSTQCLACRRKKAAQNLRPEPKHRRGESRAATSGDYVKCAKCENEHLPKSMMQPPPLMAGVYPAGALLCRRCADSAGGREDEIKAERVRRGLAPYATKKEIESAARLGAVRDLIELHNKEFTRLYDTHLDMLGMARQPKWITL